MTEALQQEIRTLEDIFESDRDPEGRVFAPLADAYRRAGELQQAVRLLNAGLARHPDFVPGHVVAAQLYVEQGLAEEAAIAARNALQLDGENVNALQSLLRVLEDSGDAEANDVRSRLVALEPDFAADAAPSPSPPPLPEEAVQSTEGEAPPSFHTPPVDLEASANSEVEELTVAGADTLVEEPTPAEEPLDAALDLVPEADMGAEEPVIDLDSLPVVSEEEGDEVEVAMSFRGGATDIEAELPTEEPVIDLDSLASVADEEVALVDIAPAIEPDVELPTEEPVIDLDDLAPVVEPEAEKEPAVDLADVAPEPEAEEPVLEMDALAPEVEEEEPAMDLADLAPEPEVEEPVLEMDALAPEVEEEEPAMELADLAPEPEVEEPVLEMDALAPEVEEEEEPPMELADLAPEPESEEEAASVIDLVDQVGSEAPTEALIEDDTEIVIDMDQVGRKREPSDAEATESASEDEPTLAGDTEDAGSQDEEAGDEGPGEPVYTRTLAELYVKQGAVGQAIEVYRHLAQVDPTDESIPTRLAELESGVDVEDGETDTLARELAENGEDAEHEVASPFAWDEGKEGEDQPDAGPTIGDYFQNLLTWKPGKRE